MSFRIFQSLIPALMLAACLLGHGLTAQSLVLHATPSGVFAEVAEEPASLDGYRIIRQRNGREPAREFTLSGALDRVQFRRRITRFNQLFPDGATLPLVMADSLWDLRTAGRSISHPAYLLAAGRAIVDTLLTEGETYTYVLQDADGRKLAEQSLRYPRPVLLPRMRVAATAIGEYPELHWHAAWTGDAWSAKVFRQDPVTGRFARIRPFVWAYRTEDSDSLHILVRDTTPRQAGYWRYYLQPTDRFGNAGPVAEVGHVLQVDDASRPMVERLQARSSEDHPAIELSWEVRSSARLRAYRLYRAEAYGGPYNLRATLPADATSYIDPVEAPREAYFYYLEAVDLANRGLRSAIVSEHYRAEWAAFPPRELTATVEEAGISLRWEGDASRDYGYIVYRAPGYEGELEAISPLMRAHTGTRTYLDTSASLQAQAVYAYAIVAVSGTNEHSEPSERVFVRQPGGVPRPAPRDLRLRERDGQIILIWEDLPARAPRTLGYHVYRKASDQDEFERLTEEPLGFNENRFVEPVPTTLAAYTYAVRAIDVGGEESPFSESKTIDLAGSWDLRPEEFEGARTTEGNQLAWTPLPHPRQVRQVVIYRAEGDGPFSRLAEVAPTTQRYLDARARADQTYRYYLQVLDLAGQASRPTSLLTLRRL